jgi:hypothetical protein
VKLEREGERPRAASVSLAGDVSESDIGEAAFIYNAAKLNAVLA